MQAFHTEGEPPASGNRSFPIIGWTRNIRKAERKIVAVYRITKRLLLAVVSAQRF